VEDARDLILNDWNYVVSRFHDKYNIDDSGMGIELEHKNIINQIAKLINEDEKPISIFHADDEFGPVPDSESQLLSQLFSGWDFTQPAEAALTSLRNLVDRYGINEVVAQGVANDIISNYQEYQKHGYPIPEGPSQGVY
jgi:hypothetical protein